MICRSAAWLVTIALLCPAFEAAISAEGVEGRPQAFPVRTAIDRQASRLARAPAKGQQVTFGGDTNGTMRCSRRTGAIIGAVAAGAITAAALAQSQTQRSSGTGMGAGSFLLIVGVAAGVGALGGALACGG